MYFPVARSFMLQFTQHEIRDKLRWETQRLTIYSSIGDRTKVQEKRQRLGCWIRSFHTKAFSIIGDCDIDSLVLNKADVVAGDEIPDSDVVGSDGEEGDLPDDPQNWVDKTDFLDDDNADDSGEVAEYPEKMPLIMPSAMGKDYLRTESQKALASQELQLREGQANDCLEHLRLALGHKALLFQTKVRHASSVKEKTKAWG